MLPSSATTKTGKPSPRLQSITILLSILVSSVILLVITTVVLDSNIYRENTPHEAIRCCGPGCRERSSQSAEEHYDESYFEWQTQQGKAKAAEKDWNDFLKVGPNDVVADLGAGGGHILATLNVKRRIAVEINENARKGIHKVYPGRIETVPFPEEVQDNSIDLLFSTSAIEHFECPLTELREMARKVKNGGRVVIGVKNEGIEYAGPTRENDVHQHLWTWNRQLLYNLVKKAGFRMVNMHPDVNALLHIGRNWTKDDFRSGEVFQYYWAMGVKPLFSVAEGEER